MDATSRAMRHRRSVSVAILMALSAGIAGSCGDSDSDEATASDVSSTAPAPTSLKGSEPSAASGTATSTAVSPGTEPVGLIALGHSGLTAENSDPAKPGEPAPENSWATGTNPDVNSIYQRMVELRPETEDHVVNAAQGAAPAAALEAQATYALQYEPTPELVIIQTIDADITCPLDMDALTQFGNSVSSVLDKIVAASPQSQILIVGQRGTGQRQNAGPFLEELVAAHPEVKPELTGDGSFPCGGFFGPSGELLRRNLDDLTNRIRAYEAEERRRCDAVPHCRTDDGAHAAYVEELENLSPDLNHLNVRGQAAVADLIWPVVEDTLGLDDATTSSAVSSTELGG